MHTLTWVCTGLLVLAFGSFNGLALAVDGHQLTLMPDKAGKGASGEVVISDKDSGQKELAINARGLKPSSVYTVWLVNMNPKMDMAGVGEGDYSFTSDAQGKGRYVATVSGTALAKWQMIEIAYHPDGDPRNMKNMGIALKASLPR